MLEKPSKETWVNWVNHPATRYFLEAVNTKREQMKEGIAEGHSTKLDTDIGYCQGIQDCLGYALVNYEYAGKDKEPEENES